MLERHPDLAEDEMIETIGDIGDRSAVPALVALLENPSSSVRRATAKSLGRIGSADAIGPLMGASAHPDDPELRRAAIQALRLIGGSDCAPVILGALEDPYPSVRVAAAEACAELSLSDSAPILRGLLEGEIDETFAEVAYALAKVGTEPSDGDVLLRAAAAMGAAVGRRRCLLGVAHRMGVEAEFYRMLFFDQVKRDQAIMDLARSRTVKGLRRAAALFHAGEEAEALNMLASGAAMPEVDAIAAHAPKEGFLLALCVISAR
jgi:hypothetical protein